MDSLPAWIYLIPSRGIAAIAVWASADLGGVAVQSLTPQPFQAMYIGLERWDQHDHG
jgi:hypothetical protein